MSLATLVRRMSEAGAPSEAIALAIEEIEALQASLDARRSADRDRKREQRERQKSANVTGQSKDSHGTVTGQSRDTPPVGSPKERNQTPSLPPAQGSDPIGSSPEPRPWTLPAGVSLAVWTDFLTNRKRKRLPNTPTAWKAFNDDVVRVSALTGIPPPKLIEKCTAKGWGAIYDPTEQQDGRRTDTLGRNQPTDGLSSTARASIAVFGR